MIGLRQDPLLQKECKKNRQYHPLTMQPDIRDNLDSNGQDDANRHMSETSPKETPPVYANEKVETNSSEIQAAAFTTKRDEVKSNETGASTKNEGKVAKDVGRGKSNQQAEANNDIPNRRQQQDRSNQYPTKIILKSNADNNSWKSILRDLILAFIPLFILFKITTHPSIANIGNSDPNRPKKQSHAEMLEQVLYSLHLEEEQVKLQQEYHFLEAMNSESECHDYATIDTTAKLKQSSKGNRKFKGKRKSQRSSSGQTKGTPRGSKPKIGKMARPMAKRQKNNDAPSSSPLMSSIADSFKGGYPSNNVNKGTERGPTSQLDSVETDNVVRGKKGSGRKIGAKKKKLGWFMYSKNLNRKQ